MNISPHQQCYCQGILTKYDNPGGNNICRSCCKLIPDTDEIFYLCLSQKCFYRAQSAQYYYVCIGCYDERNAGVNIKHDQEEKADFIYSKFMASIDIIS